jgi:hypothetical protein
VKLPSPSPDVGAAVGEAVGETVVGERVVADALAVTLPKVILENTLDGLPLSSVANILGDVFSAK